MNDHDPNQFGRMVVNGCLFALLLWILVAIAAVAILQGDVC